MSFFACLKNRLILFITLIIFLSLIPFTIFYLVNNNTTDYKIDFTCENLVSVDCIINRNNLEQTKNSLGENYNYLDIDKLENKIRIEENDSTYTIYARKKCFNKKAQAKTYLKTLLNNENLNVQVNEDSFGSISYINLNLVLIISLSLSVCLITILFILLYKFNINFYNLHINYDNKNLYRFVFHKDYWINQFKFLKNLRNLIFLTILFALMKVIGFISLPSGFANLGIGLSYLVFSVIGLIYGPAIGFIVGFVSDILGFFMGQSGTVFHIGYTLNAALAGFSYGICLYKTNVSFTKCFVSRIFVNLFVNVFLGSIWWGQVSYFTFEQTLNYMVLISLPKNLFYLIPQSMVMYLVIRSLVKPLSVTTLIPYEQANTMRFL